MMPRPRSPPPTPPFPAEKNQFPTRRYFAPTPYPRNESDHYLGPNSLRTHPPLQLHRRLVPDATDHQEEGGTGTDARHTPSTDSRGGSGNLRQGFPSSKWKKEKITAVFFGRKAVCWGIMVYLQGQRYTCTFASSIPLK